LPLTNDIFGISSNDDAYYIPFMNASGNNSTAPPRSNRSQDSPSLLFTATTPSIPRRGFDEIGAINGWEFHIDGIHRNTRGDTVLTKAVQQFLDSLSRSPASGLGSRM
jgi:hypothetical protein